MSEADANEPVVPDEDGRIQLFPMVVDVSLNSTELMTSILPWGAPSMMGVRGRTIDELSQDVVVLNYEWPIPLLVSSIKLSKIQKEKLHLSRFCTDAQLITGELPYIDVKEGKDPPDFTCRAIDGVVGLECTQFTIPDRRIAQGLFERIRQIILNENRVGFNKIRASMVYMWFSRDSKILLPFRSSDKKQLLAVVDALSKYTPDFDRLRISENELLSGVPPSIPLDSSVEGLSFYSVPLISAVPSTSFFYHTGFELGLAYSSTYTREIIYNELQRIILKHDKRGVDHLLVTVGGPSENGFGFTSEELIMKFLFEIPIVAISTKYIKRTIIHFWSSGSYFQLEEDGVTTQDNIFTAGYNVAHHTL